MTRQSLYKVRHCVDSTPAWNKQQSFQESGSSSKLTILSRRIDVLAWYLLMLFEFWRRGNYFQITIRIFCVRSTQCDFTCTCVVAVFTHVLMCRNRCRHTGERQTQTTYTAQTHHTSKPTVSVSLMIHDNMYVYIFVYVQVHVHAHRCTGIRVDGYLDMGMCMCVRVRVRICMCMCMCF